MQDKCQLCYPSGQTLLLKSFVRLKHCCSTRHNGRTHHDAVLCWCKRVIYYKTSNKNKRKKLHLWYIKKFGNNAACDASGLQRICASDTKILQQRADVEQCSEHFARQRSNCTRSMNTLLSQNVCKTSAL